MTDAGRDTFTASAGRGRRRFAAQAARNACGGRPSGPLEEIVLSLTRDLSAEALAKAEARPDGREAAGLRTPGAPTAWQ